MVPGITFEDVMDMDYLSFDDLLTIALQIDSARRLKLFYVMRVAMNGDSDGVKSFTKDLFSGAYPEVSTLPTSTRPNQGVAGLKNFLGKKGFGKKVR